MTMSLGFSRLHCHASRQILGIFPAFRRFRNAIVDKVGNLDGLASWDPPLGALSGGDGSK